MKDLLDIRKEIDGIDRQIVELFENRMVLTTQVAEYKISTGKAVFDKAREVSKLDSVASLAHVCQQKAAVSASDRARKICTDRVCGSKRT